MHRIISVLFLFVSLLSQAQTNVVNQPQFGKQTIVVPVGETLTFYDHKGTENIKDTYLNNAQSLTVFKPSNSDYVIEVCFEKFDVANDDDKPYTTTSWPGYVIMYNGVCDADNSFAWESDVYGVTERPALPDGDIIEVLCGNYTNKTLISTSTDGALSVGFLWKRGAACDGWTAKVRCIKPERMSSVAAGTYFDFVDTNPRTKNNIVLANLYIDTEGELNPDFLTSLRFNLPVNEGVIDPSTIRMQTKDATDMQASTAINLSVTPEGNNYVASVNHQLDKGHNTFTILADFLPTAKAGSKVIFEISSVITKFKTSGITSFTKADAPTIYCPGIINMPVESTVTVGDYPLDFFDDGGLEGDATPFFEGKVTFLPENPNKAVQIDFTKVRLFPAPTEGHYGQYIRVYNGTVADEKHFLREIKSYSQETVRSTAANGALTVTYESTVSAKNEGFEAKVSQISTNAMTVDKVKVSQIVGNSVSPNEKDVQILRLLITTKETLPALKVGSFAFKTNNTYKNISKATLYYTLSSYDFSTQYKVGEATITGDEFVITTSQDLSLIEGDNLFWLTMDVDGNAENGERIDAEAVSVKLNDSDFIITDGNPYGDRMVMHTVLSQKEQGIVTSIVNQSLIFKNKGVMDIYDEYEWGYDDRINIFVPKHEGLACKIDFEEFQLYYNSNEDGVHPSFKIYEGKGIDGKLLWEVNDYNDATTGPELPIISSSDDGCLTILFNPNAEKFSYTSKGFIATISEINPQTPIVSLNHYLLTTNEGGSVTAQATISGGSAPYNLCWMNAKREVIGEQTTNNYTSFSFTPTSCDDYIVVVTDNNGISTESSFRVVIYGNAATATFENLYLEPESFWSGNSREGSFVSGSYEFSNGNVPEWNYWHGFAYSNRTSTDYSNMMPDQFNSAAGGAYDGSENFAVAYVDDIRIVPLHKKKDIVKGFYVTNDAWVVNAILNGDGIVDGNFGKGDHLRLRVKGKHADGSESYIDFYLADYHSDKEEDRYYLDTWQWVDLQQLGEVTEITFEMGSTKGNLYGMTTPAFFCMDNFNGEREETSINIPSSNTTIDVSQYFTFEHPTATVKYEFADNAPTGVSLTEDGIITTQPFQEVSIVVKATQRGKQQLVRFNIGNINAVNDQIYSNSNGTRSIKAIYDAQGRLQQNIKRGTNIILYNDGTRKKVIKK